jgi:trehalose 6-phosphate phosphatase
MRRVRQARRRTTGAQDHGRPRRGRGASTIHADKGTAVRTLVEEYRPEKAMFLGDDTTDLDAFRELEKLREEGILQDILRIGVASKEGPPEIRTEADIIVDGVDGVAEVLGALAGKSP